MRFFYHFAKTFHTDERYGRKRSLIMCLNNFKSTSTFCWNYAVHVEIMHFHCLNAFLFGNTRYNHLKIWFDDSPNKRIWTNWNWWIKDMMRKNLITIKNQCSIHVFNEIELWLTLSIQCLSITRGNRENMHKYTKRVKERIKEEKKITRFDFHKNSQQKP